MLAMQPLPGVQLTLVSDVSAAPYSGMVPGHIAGFYAHDDIHIDLRKLCQFASAAFVHAQVSGVDAAGKRVLLADRPPVSYDVLSINTGSTPQMSGVPGVAAFAIPSKPVPHLLAGWERIQMAARERPVSVVIAGGGAGGVELALCMGRKLGERGVITIVHRAAEIMDTHNVRVRRIMEGVLHERGVRVLTSSTVAEVGGDFVRLEGIADPLAADFTLWVTQASPAPWIAAGGLAVDDAGFLKVNDSLQSVSHADIFAAGDVASMPQPLLRSGVYAVRMARPLTENLRRHLAGRPLAKYVPQRTFLSLVGTADGQAVASRKRLATRSASMWRLKDWIDRRFMRKFSGLPDMEPDAASAPSSQGGLAGELATLGLDLTRPRAGPGASTGATGDQSFDVQVPHTA